VRLESTRSGSIKLTCFMLVLLAAHSAHAQSGTPVMPAPTLAPLRSPEDQARENARIFAEQQAANQAAQQAAAQANGQLSPIQPQVQNFQPGTTPLAPVQPITAPVAQPQLATIPQQQVMQPAALPAPIAAPTPAPAPAPAPTAEPTSSTSSSTTTVTETPAAVVEEPAKATNTAGFAPQTSGTALPLNSGGSMPASAATSIARTNPGMDMNINPDMIGGVGADAAAAAAVPYEVQLEQRTQEIQEKARGLAYEQAKKSVLPMETYEIRDVLGRLKDTQEAVQSPVRAAPTPSNVIKTISTDPSSKPQTVALAAGNVTTINVVDVTGEPWPIVDIGFGGAFDVKPPEPGGHVIRITPLKDFARGNLVIRLLKLTTPLTFSLQSGGKNVYYRFDARVPEYGPNAKMPLIAEGITSMAGDKVTTSFLEGVPPKGAEKLAVDGIDGRTNAYKYNGTMYVRTPLALISPAWQGSATSADGMNVYVLSDAPVLLLSDKGALVRARISDAKKSESGF
jgi:intracellular multiplication protein IcmK